MTRYILSSRQTFPYPVNPHVEPRGGVSVGVTRYMGHLAVNLSSDGARFPMCGFGVDTADMTNKAARRTINAAIASNLARMGL